jgi:hypothetical protein
VRPWRSRPAEPATAPPRTVVRARGPSAGPSSGPTCTVRSWPATPHWPITC